MKQLDEINLKLLALMTNKEALIETVKNFEDERTSLIHAFRQITVPKESLNIEEIEKRKSIQITIDNLNVEICKDTSKSGPSKPVKKCRYYNRGYCKFENRCRFHHPENICQDFVQNGICRTQQCHNRHPRDCRYWTNKQEGCNRQEKCQYLHLSSKRFTTHKIDNFEPEVAIPIVGESSDRSKKESCDNCDFCCETEEELICHRGATHHQSHADKTVFTCDKCDYTSFREEALVMHTTTNHHNAAKRCNIDFGFNLPQKHQENFRNNEEQELTLNCLNCAYIASNETQLDDHLEMCYFVDPEFSCDVCNFSAKNKGGLTRHKNAQHQTKKNAVVDLFNFKS